ncbi:Sperm-associated antigen 16 protein [Lonchura striata]|uniref:Sperm-associated antigen 16 protein n=1 Tax=Lonchura striata TaxID=40157 RepID=A0A218UIR2_9PASE|nr:Sperm-associated antigen 16 protein [Lonchura striata domestica]
MERAGRKEEWQNGGEPETRFSDAFIYVGGLKMMMECKCCWNSSHAQAAPDLTKPADITITDDSKDDYQYEEVSADDEFSLPEDDEDLSKALQSIQDQDEDAQIIDFLSVLTSEKSVSDIPQAMDDFFCNFLVRLGMSRTLDCFQTEWYELIERGVFTVNDAGLVPDVYTRNQQLETENLCLKKDLESYKQSVNKAEEALLKMQKERDFHRMNHKRVVQEKNRLVSDLKRLKAHYASYEPMLKQLSEKYQNSLTQKMLTSLERDKAMEQVNMYCKSYCAIKFEISAVTAVLKVAGVVRTLVTGLQAVLESLESGYAKQISDTKGHDCTRKKGFEGPTQKALRETRQQKFIVVASSSCDPDKDAEKKMGRRELKRLLVMQFAVTEKSNQKKELKYIDDVAGMVEDSEFPDDPEGTPSFEHAKEHTQPLKSGQYQLSSIVKVHDLAVSW